MSSPQAIDSSKIARAEDIAHTSAIAEKQENAIGDAMQKDAAVLECKDGEIDMTDAVAQAGRQLARGVIEQRLRQLNPSLYFQRSHADETKSGIYRNGVFLCGMEWERSPEFTVNFVGTDENGKETLLRQVRGWRAVLDLLIRKGVIEPERTKVLFEITRGRESANWNALHN